MNLFGLTFGNERYPVFGFDQGLRAMTADEILQMQFNQAAAMQNAWPNTNLSYLQGLAQYQAPQRPLDERFAEFKVKLAAAVAKRKLPH